MHCHCGTNDRAPQWTFTDPCKPEVRPGAREDSASPAWLWRLDTGTLCRWKLIVNWYYKKSVTTVKTDTEKCDYRTDRHRKVWLPYRQTLNKMKTSLTMSREHKNHHDVKYPIRTYNLYWVWDWFDMLVIDWVTWFEEFIFLNLAFIVPIDTR